MLPPPLLTIEYHDNKADILLNVPTRKINQKKRMFAKQE